MIPAIIFLAIVKVARDINYLFIHFKTQNHFLSNVGERASVSKMASQRKEPSAAVKLYLILYNSVQFLG